MDVYIEFVDALEFCLIQNRYQRAAGFCGHARIVCRWDRELHRQKIRELPHVSLKMKSRSCGSSLSCLNWLNLCASRADCQLIHAHLPTLAVFLQMEPIRQQAAKHKRYMVMAFALSHTRLDVVFVVVQPRRSDHLVDLAFPSFGNKTLQGYIPAGEAIRRIRDLIVIVRPNFMLAG